jgi:tetrapyrrole methylase family protein/MazG family protein
VDAKTSFDELFTIIQRLRRVPDGCPWDIEQTPLSLRGGFIEETFEAIDAITANDLPHIREELGDVLLNALLVAYMYEQAGDFTVADVMTALTEKLIRRHPHVFSESEGRAFLHGDVTTSGEVLNQWDAIKANLEHRRGDSILDEVPGGFPPLLKAGKLQKKAAKKGFDWPKAEGAFDKVREEIAEVEEAAAEYAQVTQHAPHVSAEGDAPDAFTVHASSVQNAAQLHLEEEVGDAFFALVNWSRHLGVDPSTALTRANEKFSRRFRAVEKEAKSTDRKMEEMTLAELDALWDKAKEQEY